MWDKIFDGFLTHLMHVGDFRLTFPDGTTRRYGDGSGDPIGVTLHDPTLPRKIIMSPDMAVGEAYMDERLTIENDDLSGFLELAIRNVALQGDPWFRKPLALGRHMMRYLQQFNPVGRSRANVAHHYDLSGELYDLFLDEDRTYARRLEEAGVDVTYAEVDGGIHGFDMVEGSPLTRAFNASAVAFTRRFV